MKNFYITIIASILLTACTMSGGKHRFSYMGSVSPWDMLGNNNIKTYNDYEKTRYIYNPTDEDKDFCKYACEKIENNYFYIDVKFKEENIVKQKKDNDCWESASIMLLKHSFKGISDQKFKEIANEYLNENKSQNEFEIYSKIIDIYRQTLHSIPLTGNFFYYSLVNGFPVLVGLDEDKAHPAHVVIVTGVKFSFRDRPIYYRGGVNWAAYEICIIDPDGGKRVTMDAENFKKRASFGISLLPYTILNPDANKEFFQN